MNRIDRVTAILIQLQSRKVVKAQDIAERFGISLRTVYRDIATLEEAGIPVIGEAGVGYSIMDGYRLPPVMFTKEEATAFITAEKIIEKFTDGPTTDSFRSAMYKVRAVLRSTEKQLLENIEEHIEVYRRYAPAGENAAPNTLQPVLQSIAEKKVLLIHYTAFNTTEPTVRFIEPVGLVFYSGYWHTIAWCRLRNAYRDFRADRMRRISCTDEPYGQDHPPLKEYIAGMARKENLQTVVISILKDRSAHLQEAKYYYGFVSQQECDDHLRMTFLTSSPEHFVRWFITYADEATIIEPESMQETLKSHFLRISEKIGISSELLT
ncbi:helix-turn-helix transcriptional regulator [Chitinophagaceae bacterium MMS25-I14]